MTKFKPTEKAGSKNQKMDADTCILTKETKKTGDAKKAFAIRPNHQDVARKGPLPHVFPETHLEEIETGRSTSRCSVLSNDTDEEYTKNKPEGLDTDYSNLHLSSLDGADKPSLLSTNGMASSLIKKRKNIETDEAELSLEAEIKRVALEDTTQFDSAQSYEKKYKLMKTDAVLGRKRSDVSIPDKFDKEFTMRLLCHVKEAALIIGPKGTFINNLKAATKTHVITSENIEGVQERVITVKGAICDVAKCGSLIAQKLIFPHCDFSELSCVSESDFDKCGLKWLVPHELVGFVIGKGGNTLKLIEQENDAQILVSPHFLPASNERLVTVSSTTYLDATIIDIAKILVDSKKRISFKNNYYNPTSRSVHAQEMAQGQRYGLLQNSNHANKKSLSITGIDSAPPHLRPSENANQKNNYSFELSPFTLNAPGSLMPNSGLRNNIPTLPPSSVPLAGAPIPNTYSVFPFIKLAPYSSAPLGIIHQDCFILDVYVGKIIGKGGKNIKFVKKNSGAEILIDQNPHQGERKFTIIGTPMSTQIALAILNRKIESIIRG
ncbi:hypothetical protein ACO0RG_003388 [Hanseniaspora osmophila]